MKLNIVWAFCFVHAKPLFIFKVNHTNLHTELVRGHCCGQREFWQKRDGVELNGRFRTIYLWSILPSDIHYVPTRVHKFPISYNKTKLKILKNANRTFVIIEEALIIATKKNRCKTSPQTSTMGTYTPSQAVKIATDFETSE